MNKKTGAAFLRNALLMTAALAVIIIFMREWGAGQIIGVVLVAALAAMQWGLWFYIRRK